MELFLPANNNGWNEGEGKNGGFLDLGILGRKFKETNGPRCPQ